MERIKHIKETSQQNTGAGETPAIRDVIVQESEYNPVTETRSEQISVREYLDSVDESALKEIFAEYFRKAGSDEHTMNWIPLDKVRILYRTPKQEKKSESPYGQYSPHDGVKLYSHLLWDNLELLLWTLIHEQCHAISQDVQRRDQATGDEYVKTGLSSTTIEADDNTANEQPKTYLSDINEGVTELLTERIYTEYKKRTGNNEYFTDDLDNQKIISAAETTAANEKFAAYQRNWQTAKVYIGIISAITDVPREKVEEGVLRSYLRNGKIIAFQDENVINVLSEIHPDLEKTLYTMLSDIPENSAHIQDYVDYLGRLDIPDDLKDRFYAALQEVKNEWGEAYKLADQV